MDLAQHPRGALGAPGVVYECLNDAHPVIDGSLIASNADNHVRCGGSLRLKAKGSPDISRIVQIASHPHSGLLGSSSAGTSK